MATNPNPPRPNLSPEVAEWRKRYEQMIDDGSYRDIPPVAEQFRSEADLIQGCRHGCDHSRASEPEPLVTRTGRRRSWWQRGWRRG